LTDEQLAADVTRIEPGWQWQHRLYAERDLETLETPS
jgi:hypothetical protein